ncbi:hypothetical protein [Emticicia fontis]
MNLDVKDANAPVSGPTVNPDPYKIPLKTAKEWVNNWLDFDLHKAKIQPSEMKAFAVRKQDLQDLSNLAPDANWIRMYIGLELLETGVYQPHLLMVNAVGPEDVSPATRLKIKDLINYDPASLTDQYVNDYSKICPPYCDPDSELNN